MLTNVSEAILRLAGLGGFTSFEHQPVEVVAPRRTLDGLFKVKFPDQPEPTLVLIEIEAYPSADAARQVFEDIALVLLEYRQVPEVVHLFLKPRNNNRVTGEVVRSSARGTVHLAARWPVVELWKLDSEELFKTGEVGLLPLIPLTQMTRNPDDVFAECLEKIQQIPMDGVRSALLAVAKIFANFAEVHSARWAEAEFQSGVLEMKVMQDILAELKEREQRELAAREAERVLLAQESMERGHSQGLSQGTIVGKQAMVRRIVLARFPLVSANDLEPLESFSVPDFLDELAIVAATCNTAEQFLQALNTVGK